MGVNQNDEVNKESVENYKKLRLSYEKFTKDVREIVEKIIQADEKNIHVDHIESRTKTVESFAEKISRDGKDYQNPLTDVTDLCGVRIVVYSQNDIKVVSELIRNNFDIDEENSGDKAKKMKVNEFGYLSTHLIVSLRQERVQLPEYKDDVGKKAEIQIRTALQNAWATIEHKLNYKPTTVLPDEQKRDFYRLSAVLELVDKELQSALTAYEEKKAEYKGDIKKNNIESIELNSDSLRYYLESESVLKELRKINISRLKVIINDKSYPSKQFLYLLSISGLDSFTKLSKLITDASLSEKLQQVVSIWEKEILDENLKLIMPKLTLLRVLIFFASDTETRHKILSEDLVSAGMKAILSKIS